MKEEILKKLAPLAEKVAAGLEDAGVQELRELAEKIQDPDLRKMVDDVISAVDEFADKQIGKISEE